MRYPPPPFFAHVWNFPCFSSSRGNSLPPQLKPEMTPIAPPRSRRGSRRGSMISLADSTQSLDVSGLADRLRSMTGSTMAGSTMSLKDRHPIHQSVHPPNRPPRRKDRTRKSILGLPSIDEDNARYDVSPSDVPLNDVRQKSQVWYKKDKISI